MLYCILTVSNPVLQILYSKSYFMCIENCVGHIVGTMCEQCVVA